MSSSMQHLGILGFGTRGTRASTIGPDRPPAIQTLFTPLSRGRVQQHQATCAQRYMRVVLNRRGFSKRSANAIPKSRIVDEVAAVRIEAAMTEN